MPKRDHTLLTAFGITARIIAVVGGVECAIMVLLAVAGDELSNMQRVWVDTALLAVLSTPVLFYWIVKPVVAARDRALGGARFLALHDPLTQLPNRRLLYEHIDRCLSSIPRHGQFGALIYLDLDGFKSINDRYGHRLGDAVLVEIADRLKQVTRSEDVPCRLGGDEFVVLVQDIGDEEETARRKIETIAGKIRATIKRPFERDDLRVQVGCSIGVRMLWPQRTTADQVLVDADQAMYHAKKTAPGTVVFSDEIGLPWYGIVPLGIEEIDREHRAIDTLFKEATASSDRKLEYVRRIADVLPGHFRNEQLISDRLALNFGNAHAREHRRLTALVTAIANRATEQTAHADLLSIRDLVERHAAECDRELVCVERETLAEQAV